MATETWAEYVERRRRIEDNPVSFWEWTLDALYAQLRADPSDSDLIRAINRSERMLRAMRGGP